MRPVLTPVEMQAVDAAARDRMEELIRRAGGAVARAAIDLLGGAYGRHVTVIAGRGNNGRDGLEAACRLQQRGAAVTVHPAASAPEAITGADLVVDAAYGTGFRGSYLAPEVGRTPVLAVDIPSGVDGTTGTVSGRALSATRTVTFAAAKPGLLLGDGRRLAGVISVADIGLDVGTVGGRSSSVWVEDDDVAVWVPRRSATDHKWSHAVWVVGGSPGMTGASTLVAAAAARAGAGYVRVSRPGVPVDAPAPLEAVVFPLEEQGWSGVVLDGSARFGSLVVGPGLGRSDAAGEEVRTLAAGTDLPTVIDGDGLWALGEVTEPLGAGGRTVLTPHDGEYARLCGEPAGGDRVSSARALAVRSGAVVLLKGPTTVVAEPDGRTAFVTSGDQRLATAGTGDVLSGMVGAFLARGAEPFEAAAAAAHVHGRAAARSPEGMVASDLVAAVAQVLTDLDGSST